MSGWPRDIFWIGKDLQQRDPVVEALFQADTVRLNANIQWP